MRTILRLKDENGNWVEFPALIGEKGDKGDAGAPGAAGYTPVKGVDYFDGADGKNGADGYTPIKGVDYFDGSPGANGKDGVSVTHSWNGTVLTVTSASGTSSANLKGDKGDTGSPGVSAVYIGSTEPTAENINVWIDPGGEGEAPKYNAPLSEAEIRAICT